MHLTMTGTVTGLDSPFGLLLLVRFILFLVSAIVDIGSPQDPQCHVNLLVISISTVVLQIWVWNASGGVYKQWYLNALESSHLHVQTFNSPLFVVLSWN